MKKITRFSSKKQISSLIEGFLDELNSFYKTIDHNLYVNEEKINLSKEKIKRFQLTDNVSFYLESFKSISSYRDSLKTNVEKFLSEKFENSSNLKFEFRTKNINSIFSKIYLYNNKKEEKGEIQINKCLNDLFGIRIVLPIRSFEKLYKILTQICLKKDYLKLIDSSKGNYKAAHVYLKQDNFSMQWEIQFWLAKNDKGNRKSHKQYKQAYTLWEQMILRGKIVSIEE